MVMAEGYGTGRNFSRCDEAEARLALVAHSALVARLALVEKVASSGAGI